MVPGPGEEYGEEDYVLLPDVFGDMGKKKSKQPPKPSLPSHKEAEPPKREKPSKERVPFKVSASDNEERGKGLNKPVEKEKRWADVMEEDKAEAARARAELDEKKRRWRARLQEEEVLNLDAPSGKTVMELLAEREAQGERAAQPKAGRILLVKGWLKRPLL
jgi:phosphoketolase